MKAVKHWNKLSREFPEYPFLKMFRNPTGFPKNLQKSSSPGQPDLVDLA